jgi:hypothetical protein
MSFQTEQLPPVIRKQAEDYIECLLLKYQQTETHEPKPENPRAKLYGMCKGKMKMAEDVDAPLEDFKANRS